MLRMSTKLRVHLHYIKHRQCFVTLGTSGLIRGPEKGIKKGECHTSPWRRRERPTHTHMYQRVKYGFLPEECSAAGNREMQRKKEACQNKTKTQLLGAGGERENWDSVNSSLCI